MNHSHSEKKHSHKKGGARETFVHFLLDKSGSMESIRDKTISGFNEYLNGLKMSKDPIRFSLTLFDTISIETPYIDMPIKEVKRLTKDTYRPSAGTPLYDAVVNSVEDLAKWLDGEDVGVVVAIMTDGEENASTEHNEKCMKELIERLQAKGNYTFVYMGANQDSWGIASQWGLSRGNVMDFKSNQIDKAFDKYARSTVMYAASVSNSKGPTASLGTDDFLSPKA